MPKVLYFDIAALTVAAIIIAAQFFRRMTSGRSNTCLLLLLAAVVAAGIFDIWAECYGIWLPADALPIEQRWFLYDAYYAFRLINTPLYILYIIAATDTWHNLRQHKGMLVLVVLPYLVVLASIVLNHFNGLVYYVDSSYIYHRGPAVYVNHVMSAIYMIFGFVYLIHYRKVLTADKFVALLMMFPLNIIAVLIQLFIPEMLVEIFMTTMTIMLVTIVVQRPEEMINPVVGVRSRIAYETDMGKAFMVKKPMSVIFVKLTNARSVATVLGHTSNNDLMRRIGAELTQSCAHHKLGASVYYLEEGAFAAMSECGDEQRVEQAAQEISRRVARRLNIDQLALDFKPCVCYVRCPGDIDSCETLLSFGDTFYTYLPSGTCPTVVGRMEDPSMLQLQLDLDAILHRAVREQRFEMYYQPIFDVRTGRFASAEALIRLNDEDYGFISPALFIPAAEKNGTILQIGEFVIEDVCRFLERCNSEGVPLSYVELNLSMVQCMQQDLAQSIMACIERHGLRPEQLNLEITETSANTAQDIVETNMNALAQQGVYFSLDDFGTGYSNVSRIFELPFRIVKLDKSLADRVGSQSERSFLLQLVLMLKEIGLEVVVEGLETRDAVELFSAMGCDYIQGYYFSRPLPEEDFLRFLREH
ncbi:MAG: EAL domain-containing protein [Coriobacteriales bacterium]